MLNIIVQKFGGTSVASKEARQQVIGKIKGALDEGLTPVVAVSAMGRKGQPYATDSLLSLVATAEQAMAQNVDLLLSCGEIISAVVLADELAAAGLDAVVLTGQQAGIVTDDQFNDARIVDLRPAAILTQLAAGKIVIVAGFQGATEAGAVTTLGRGGSDTTASALGIALDAGMIEIYTDVEGIMTADPRIVPDAKILAEVTYNELCHLAYQGAKVVHPRAVELAMVKQIPLRVRSTFSAHQGTLVTSDEGGKMMEERLITGIAYLDHIAQFQVQLPEMVGAEQKLLQIFSTLAQQKISVDFINIYPLSAIFTVQMADVVRGQQLLEALQVPFVVRENCAKVSVVGANITGVPGVMAQIMSALVQENIAILQTADSYTTIWCLVRGTDKDKAVRALHRQFALEEH